MLPVTMGEWFLYRTFCLAKKVKAVVYEDRGGSFCRAEPTEILVASPDRVTHFWKQAGPGGAGGAEFGHIKLARQRELKADVIEEALQRMAGIELRPVVEAAPGDDEANGLGYRTRVQLHVDEAGTVGPYRERSHEVVKVRDLPLAVEEIRETEMHNKNFQDVRKIEVSASSTGQVQWRIDNKVKGDERLVERAAGRTFRISGGGFWQVHKKAADLLASCVNDMVQAVGIDKEADNLDLYGGVGLFTSALAGRVGKDLRMTSVESFRQATDDATLNLSDLPKVKAVCAPVERFLNEKVGNLDKGGKTASPRNSTIVLDPPRAGAGAKVVDQLMKIAPKHIVYVACDPIALARDLKQFLAGDYQLKELRAFDLFPHTHHVECVASLVRKS
ncbi:class I SAM-dependent RNA methyltransferase [Rhodoluna sp. KAS3]|uniref:class I SAM-dependent RNA methyltransferase n=1 Tax=Rhodoluna sp. KAS3 TaxID=942880 RepID=UPI00222F3240|nr:class I SAM-dependent RNA methyltransferase [Rhodoluna sp. KAS3]